MGYKWCIVPQCRKSSINSPNKIFISVPKNPKRRKKWLQLARRNPKTITMLSNVFMCEDHFDIEKDFRNYMRYKMGFSKLILLTNEAVPTKFHCQENRKSRMLDNGYSRGAFLKRQRADLVAECLQSQNANKTNTESLQKDDRTPATINKPKELPKTQHKGTYTDYIIRGRPLIMNKRSLKMTNVKKLTKERLYLERGQREVYVDTYCLAQHQIEGVRSLYQQYVKKKPGVILNNPEGYGKSIQVALFLDSIQDSLTNPILIWCEDDDKIINWKQTIIKWTKYTEDDIAIDARNVYVKKKIFLRKRIFLEPSYARRDWGVVVVKSDFVLKQLLNTPIKATFKIWLTTTDMRKDVEMFNSIYTWLYSEKKFDINKYIDSISVVQETPLFRAKLFDSFLNDIVIMKNDFTPSKKPEPIQEAPSRTKVSRKNKDATGTKIKRSKTSKESDTSNDGNNDLDNFYTKIESDEDLIKVTNSKKDGKINMDFDTSNTEETGLDVESFIKQKEPVKCEEYEYLNESNSTDTEDLSFTNALNDIVENENDEDDINDNDENDVSDKNYVNDKNDANDENDLISVNDENDLINVNDENDVIDGNSESIINEIVSTDEKTNVKNDTNKKKNGEQLEMISSDSDTTDKETLEFMIKSKKKEIDIIKSIAKLEEDALKKFKNSILDDFF